MNIGSFVTITAGGGKPKRGSIRHIYYPTGGEPCAIVVASDNSAVWTSPMSQLVERES